MDDQRFIIEMGMGLDQHGMDYQKAAERAISDAMGHASLLLFESTGIPTMQMRVQVTVGVQEPERLDCAALAALIPLGQAEVRAVFGGQNVTTAETGATIVVANAAVEAFLPYQGAGWHTGTS